jgi:hypothetical protein
VLPLDVVAYDPCRGDEVELAGTLSFQGLTTVSADGATGLQYAVQATEVRGSGLGTEAPYELVGEAQGLVSPLGRAVTADDFHLIAQDKPEVGRASAEPRYTITLGVTLSELGAIEAVVPERVFTDEKCL